ncbi:Cytidine deaminase-like protein [Glarea lozoyensis ATCC 20868]|uniref:Cytidine deaminase-like protein n=1 Tax=Glarea lozoyensis (strain ATCC 20868 / MF5171) TaxID=1116229 RepID=S3DTW9_GLAL2|nr:Cytidine deaminase-like protein [Glarea lozoyensis ATCC 20868]EPE35386.1 Cytidine deaminase-like protein [Glarea lozoyensis ATCC 20868]
MSEDEKQTHLTYMREALAMAELALQTSETPVGCIIQHPTHGTIGRGMNATNRTRNGTMHAEFIAINQILAPPSQYTPDILKECTLYVTVEPCIMCASLLRQFGIKKVFFGASNEKFGGTGGVLDVHLGNGRGIGGKEGDYEVSGGWLREEAIVMLRRFYVQENERAPEPRKKAERVLKLEVEPLGELSGNGVD